MACSDCRDRAALLTALAPAIERLTITRRQTLLELLALADEQLCHAVGVKYPFAARRREQGASATPRTQGEICRHDPAYPPGLAQLDCAPAVLHATCEAERLHELLAKPTVAIVGDRWHTYYGHQVTFELAGELARGGVTIISGLHQGIDGIAHHGALGAGGQSIAVMGCSPERPYPRQQDHLHRRIRANGAAISEFPAGFFPPMRWCFVVSQRIIAALASIVVVVEAGERSPALFTAQIASDLGRDIAVVPGRLTEPGGKGTFALLRDGAHPIAGAQDVLDLLCMTGIPINTPTAACAGESVPFGSARRIGS
jgi:DNA protecting protein DprA